MHTKGALLPIIAAALAAGVMGVASVPVHAQGAQGEMFRRHFFRGQAYHGEGYAAQVGEMGGRPAARGAASGPNALEATVEEGTPGAAIARQAAGCAARFKSYDASSGTYVGRGGRRLHCP